MMTLGYAFECLLFGMTPSDINIEKVFFCCSSAASSRTLNCATCLQVRI